ncbi:hypothetical protein L950_0200195 [Sphingobacterium sp. IITKGP-BTPF85]|nr:hypothetical protein L950_0200195 [Sphingobacterium sp. IITKGP-BTPF85]
MFLTIFNVLGFIRVTFGYSETSLNKKKHVYYRSNQAIDCTAYENDVEKIWVKYILHEHAKQMRYNLNIIPHKGKLKNENLN